MKNSKFILSGAIAAIFLTPAALLSYSLIGGNLGIGTSGNGYQRDVRVWNNAADVAANNNTTPEANHPGALGASLAVWKAAEAWNSNTTQAQKNFDFDWQGANTSSAADQNTVSWGTSGCGGSTLAYTETPISNGWRILMCEGWTWADGPGSPSFNQVDIQGVAAHELGHALGMGHSTVNCGSCNDTATGHTTMCAFICGTGTSERTIQTDDAAGLQAIYGAKPANKPTITSLSGSFATGGLLTINGTNFNGTLNVKFTAGTSQNTGTIPGVVYGVTPVSSTQIQVTIPATAQDGNVLVWIPTPTPAVLSNPFPIDINFIPPPPPTLSSVSPATVQAFAGGTITLTGTGFTGATQVNSGGTLLTPPLGFTIVNDTTITYNAPTPTALGTTNVNVTSLYGTSNNGSFSYIETNPPKMSAGFFAIQNQPYTWTYGAGAGDVAYLIYAFNPTTFNYLGFDILSGLLILNVQTLDPTGLGSFTTTIAPGTGGLTLYSQVATLDGVTLQFVGASPVTSTLIF